MYIRSICHSDVTSGSGADCSGREPNEQVVAHILRLEQLICATEGRPEIRPSLTKFPSLRKRRERLLAHQQIPSSEYVPRVLPSL